ncbi:hypothetical protein VNI00_005456 [Paramarasmius palmivorus]|uniref:Uncharacterized protein n=1 Tax=Paramarasmius palmivorus TaxID=297713 RepID=A0AAW0DFB5_9AGAR
MSSTYSLYKEITTPKRAGDYKSTLAVRYFIETLARDACQAQWNASPYCRILLEARETCDTIHSNIELVSQGKDEIARWNAFDHFVYDLDRLEGSLRDLFVAVDQENEIFEQLKGITLDDTEGLKTLMGLLEDLIDHVWKGDSVSSLQAMYAQRNKLIFASISTL